MFARQQLARQVSRMTSASSAAVLRRPRHLERRALASFGACAVMLVAAAALSPAAHAADATNAVWAGTGTYTDPVTGQVYGKGGTATLTVTTTNDTKCVNLNPSWTNDKPTQTSSTAKTSWQFTLTVPSTTGTFSVTASASPNFTSGNNPVCTGSTPGNASVSASYIVDNGPPVVTGVGTPAVNQFGWRNVTTTIAWSAVDGGSGIKSGPTPASDSVTTDTPFDGVTKTSTATDNVGNVGTGSLVVKVDKTLPTINASRNPAPNGFGWNNTDVTIGFVCGDVLSGIQSCTGGGSVVVSTEGTDQSVPGEAVDNAGNKNSAGVEHINIDKTKPTLSGAPTTAPNGDGWYNGNVAIAWTANDDRSGVVATPVNSTISGEGLGLFVTGSVSDKAGNSTSADSAKVNIDRTTPSTDATAPSGWTNTSQTVTLAAKDALSGVKATYYKLDGGAATHGTSVAISGDGTHKLEYWSVDKAGNAEPAKNVDVKIDGTSPTISHTQSPLANANRWNRTSVTVKFVCEDATSGIASCTSDQVVSDEGKDQLVTGTAKDNAGNTATDPARVSIDKTDPKIDAAVDRNPNANAALNGAGWYAADVTVSFTCSDALSGIDGPTGCPAPTIVADGYDQSASGTAVDAAGNTAAAGVSKINIDKTAPSLSGKPTSDPNGAGWYNGNVAIAWTCDDSLSGVHGACPANSTITGEGNDLVASETISDNAGNTKSADSSPAVKIDRKAPGTTAGVGDPLPSGWYPGAVKVTLTASDSLSGVDKTYYSVDGGLAQVYAGAFEHNQKGTHAIRFWSVDKAGNVEDKDAPGHSITLKIDDVKPTITGSRTPAANAHDWNNSAVDVSFVCKDEESGIAGCVGNERVFAETTVHGVSISGNAVDNAGNTNEATVGPIRIDLTKPTLVGTPTTQDNANGWYKGDATIAWAGQDGLSGIDSTTLPGDSVITGEGAGLKAGPKTVKDKAGNESDATHSTAVNIDRTAPTISGKTVNEDGTNRSANAAGWFNSAVRVRFSCADALSLLAECPADVVLSGDGKGQSASGTAYDKADNGASTTVGGIDIDSHAPKSQADIVCTSKNGFCRGSKATVNFTASDPAPVSGVVTSGVKEIKYQVGTDGWKTGTTVDVPLNRSGKATVTFYAVDNAGNAETVNSVSINYDTIAPTVTHTLLPVPANGWGWNKVNTTVQFSAVDSEEDASGVDPTTITPDVVVSAETVGELIKGSAEDFAGNVGYDSVTVKLDKTNPTISATPSGTQGSNGWYRSAVSVAFACADTGTVQSSVATCTGTQVLGHGDSVTGKAVDKADNEVSTTVGPVQVDTDAPAITLDGVKDGGEYTLGSVPPKTCTASDVGPSGLDGSCQMTVTGGLPNGVGTFSYTATAKDMAGNVTTLTGSYKVRYRVVYDTAFWLQPINDTAHTTSTTTSVFKAGSTVPAKFRITDANGNAVQTNSAPAWVTPVKGSATTAPVDESVYSEPAMSGSTFSWSATDQHYQFNWGSPKNGFGYYWRIGVKLDDGTIQAVNIGLR
ncbi:MAG: PxKF domain-containing protein [Chloroflexota bacterium]|nr:PxKF domain-containing protein [Chloroflexota bacterium]